jgi:hypothetical protein
MLPDACWISSFSFYLGFVLTNDVQLHPPAIFTSLMPYAGSISTWFGENGWLHGPPTGLLCAASVHAFRIPRVNDILSQVGNPRNAFCIEILIANSKAK